MKLYKRVEEGILFWETWDIVFSNELWPKIANYFEMEVAPPLNMPFTNYYER